MLVKVVVDNTALNRFPNRNPFLVAAGWCKLRERTPSSGQRYDKLHYMGVKTVRSCSNFVRLHDSLYAQPRDFPQVSGQVFAQSSTWPRDERNWDSARLLIWTACLTRHHRNWETHYIEPAAELDMSCQSSTA